MRSRPTVTAIALMCLAGASGAADTAACFGRTYDSAHLDAHPMQQVRDIRALRVGTPAVGDIGYELRVRFRDDPREFRVQPGCWDDAGQIECVVDCDGGVMRPVLARDGSLRITTAYLRAETGEASPGEGGCTDPVTRNITDEATDGSRLDTVFVLQPRDRQACAWGDATDTR